MRTRFDIAVGLYVLAAVLAACASEAGSPSSRTPATSNPYGLSAEPGTVFKVRFVTSGGRLGESVEWVDATNGRWRQEGRHETTTFDGETYSYATGDHVEIMTGDHRFHASRRYGAGSIVSLQHALGLPTAWAEDAFEIHAERFDGMPAIRFDVLNREWRTSVIVDQIPAAEVDDSLFAPPAGNQNGWVTRQLDAGQAPTLPVDGYWFGSTHGGLEAVTAVEFRTEITAYTVYYERSGHNGVTSVTLPVGEDGSPAGEVYVLCEPLDSPLAKRRLEARTERRVPITLANGERALLVADRSEASSDGFIGGYAVVTDTTLIQVVGRVRGSSLEALASQLRPVG